MSDVRCVVNANDFQKALSKVLRAAPRRSSLFFLTEACVTFGDGLCTFTVC